MAHQNRRAIAQLIAPLIKHGHQYSFYQAIRYLNNIAGKLKQNKEKPFDIAILPPLSLAFTRHDIKTIEYHPTDNQIEITATFLGLYGTASPLPNFYTEDIMQEIGEDITVSKDFLDMFHRVLYQKLYHIWLKYRFNQCAFEDQNKRYIRRLYCLIGLGDKTLANMLPNPKSLIKYIGLFNQRPRSSKNLEILLKDYFNVEIEIRRGQSSLHKIATDQQLRLGVANYQLGQATYLGEQVQAYGASMALEIKSLSYAQFNLFSYAQPYAKALAFLIKFFCTTPAQCFVSLFLNSEAMGLCQLGLPTWSKLGQNAWIASKVKEVEAVSYTIN